MARALGIRRARFRDAALLARARRHRHGMAALHSTCRLAGEDQRPDRCAVPAAREQLLHRPVQRLVLRGRVPARRRAFLGGWRPVVDRRLLRQRQRAPCRGDFRSGAADPVGLRLPVCVRDGARYRGVPVLVAHAESHLMLPYLSLAIWVPIVAGLLVLAVNRDRDAPAARWLALVGAVAGFAVTIPLYTQFTLGTAEMQFVETIEWIPRFSVNYLLGVDGISVLFILLNSFITVLAVWAGWVVIQTRVAQYMAAFLIMSWLINGVFASLDAVLFYVFFDAQLIPMYLIIGVWGGPNRIYAALKFFLYTFLGSVLMLVALIYLYTVSGSFSILEWYQLPLSLKTQEWLFAAFFIAFAVKVPMWPVHTWLPDAHVEAPTGGSVVLAAITLKVGAYGFVRFILPILPDASHYLAGFVITLSLIAIIYIGLVALVQTDMKKLIAYSSISHMGFVTLGFFLFSQLGVEGGLAQMISHGFVSAALFLCVGVMYDRLHSRLI